MNLYDGKTKLAFAARKLMIDWHATLEHWSDDASLRFEEEHIAPYEPTIASTLKALDRLAEVFERAEQECRADDTQ